MTPEHPTLRQQWKQAPKVKKVGILLSPLIALIVAVALAAAISGDSPTEEPEAATEPTGEPQNPKYDATEDNGRVDVTFAISGSGPSAAQDDAARALEWAVAEYPDHDRIVLRGQATTVDDYGNETEDNEVVTAHYEAATTEQIDWDNFNRFSMWDIRDGGPVSPSLLDE